MKTSQKLLAILLMVTTTSCVVVSRRVDIDDLDYRKPVQVTNSVKAHLKDGSTVVYPNGVTVTTTEIKGAGTRYPFAGSTTTEVLGLAYVRLGLPVPAAGPVEAAKTLSLLSGGLPFFAEAFAAEPRSVPRNRATINRALEDARRKVEATMRTRGGGELTSTELSSLAAVWTDLQRAVNGPA